MTGEAGPGGRGERPVPGPDEEPARDVGGAVAPAPAVGRRVVVLGGLAAVAAAAIGIARTRRDDTLAGEDGGVGGDELEALRRVGAAYLRVRPEEASIEVLVAALPTGATGPAGATGSVALPEVPAVEAAVRADHAAGRVVEVDGWRFAETAGRLAALAHLTA